MKKIWFPLFLTIVSIVVIAGCSNSGSVNTSKEEDGKRLLK